MIDALTRGRTAAIMQPYFFPYLGYYQLVWASDIFVFYDDVNFIKGGWINRNRILINGAPAYITVAVKGASSNKLIQEVQIVGKLGKLLRSVEVAYGSAPYFTGAMEVVARVLEEPASRISELASRSVISVMEYLGIQREFRFSSDAFGQTQGMGRADRLIEITKGCGATTLINSFGGQALYSKEYFRDHGVQLYFLQPSLPRYDQPAESFHPGLSIIDVLMFNSPDQVRNMLTKATLV